MGQTSEHSGLLRILLADEDDANAFLFQCGINRLDRPCAFQRVGQPELLPEKVAAFRPDILIAAGAYAVPDRLREMRQFTDGHPIICAVDTFAEGELALEAGASDCVLKSQVDELHACIEWHLTGRSKVPYFKKGVIAKDEPRAAKSPSKLDLKLADFDRRVGAVLRKLARAADLKARKLARASRIAGVVAAREISRNYTKLKVQWQRVRRMNRAQTPAREQQYPDRGLAPSPREVEPRVAGMVRIVSPPKTSAAVPERSSRNEGFDNDTLRTLELSFKTLFHTSLDPMFLLDGLGSFLHANAPGCALLGLAPADLLGKSLLEFVPPSERTQASALWEALLIEGQQKAEIQVQSTSGETRELFISARTNIWFGIHLLVARDQTELKLLRAAVGSQPGEAKFTTPQPDPAAQESHLVESMPAP